MLCAGVLLQTPRDLRLPVADRRHTMEPMAEERSEESLPDPKDEKIWVVCCMCNKVLQVGNIPGDKRTSHGLCSECSVKTLEEIRD